MWIYNETIIKTPKAMTIGDVLYPRQIFKDKDLLAELGILPYTMPEQKDQRYWWNNETPRDVDTLKEQMISTIKQQVGTRLQASDWQVIREMDGGQAMSADVKAYRTAIRDEGNLKELEVAELVTLDDVILYEATPFTEVRKVAQYTENEDGTTTESYGTETETSTRNIDLTKHFDAVDPMAEVDPAFVSLTKV